LQITSNAAAEGIDFEFMPTCILFLGFNAWTMRSNVQAIGKGVELMGFHWIIKPVVDLKFHQSLARIGAKILFLAFRQKKIVAPRSVGGRK